MLKILIGLVAAIVVAAAGFFGFAFYTQHRVAGEVEAAFEQIRATGSKASHGKVSFDLLSRTLTIANIAAESAAQPAVSVKIASFTASGVGQPEAGRFSVDSIEASDIEVDVSVAAAPANVHVVFKMPRLSGKDYSGPAGPLRLPASSSAADVYRFMFEQLTSIAAASITAPSLAGTVRLAGTPSGGAEFAYTGLTMQNIKSGKIAAMTIDSFGFTIDVPQAGTPRPGKTGKLTANLANLASYDFDAGAFAALFDSQRANDDGYYRVYRQITAGAYTIASGQDEMNMRIDGMTIEDVSVRPSRLQLPALFAMMPQAGSVPTPAQAREMIDGMARLYEGMRIGNAEMRGLSMGTPQGPVKLSTMKFNLENGKVGEFALEGLETPSPKGPVKVGRFALMSLDIANFMRMSAKLSNPAQPSPDLLLGLLPLIQGVEVKNFLAPYKDTGKPINVDLFSLNWGQFVGPIPSKARLIVKMSAPLDTTDLGQQMLVAAGITTTVIDADLGAAWTEASRSFALEPVTLELGSLLSASARVSLANVPRQVFSPNLALATAASGQIEAGTIELTLRDLGAVDVAVTQYARTQSVSREAARQAIVETIKASSEKIVSANPDAAALVEALVRFIETPRQSLSIRLQPLGKVPALQLIQLLQTDPLVALGQFRIETSTGL
jgi:hypothetical protein